MRGSEKTNLTFVTLCFFFNGKYDPAYEGEEGHDERAGQSKEKEQQQNPTVRRHLDVLQKQLPRGHLERKTR